MSYTLQEDDRESLLDIRDDIGKILSGEKSKEETIELLEIIAKLLTLIARKQELLDED